MNENKVLREVVKDLGIVSDPPDPKLLVGSSLSDRSVLTDDADEDACNEDTCTGCALEKASEGLVKAGADIISIHPESTFHFPAVINKIVSSNIAAGVVLNPGTPVSLIEALVADIDIVVVMLVNPGWGGKKYLSQAISKIKQIHELAETQKFLSHISLSMAGCRGPIVHPFLRPERTFWSPADR